MKCGGTMKKGGVAKKKMQMGGSKIGDKIRGAADKIRGAVKKRPAAEPVTPADTMYTNTTPGEIAKPPMKKGGASKPKMQKGGQPLMTKTMPGYNANTNTMQKGGKVAAIKKPKMAKGGATKFGMLSVKAGIDKNPKPTAADRIAGAKKKK